MATSDAALKRRLGKMRSDRVDAMRTQARRGIALDLLDETGEVTTAAVDERMSTMWADPTDDALDNLIAQKTAAGVEFERSQVEAAQAAVDRSGERVEKARARLEDAQGAAEGAAQELAAAKDRLAQAEELAALAALSGDAAAAPAPDAVAVNAASADTTGA